MNKQEQEELYNEIVKFYDLAENVLDVIEKESARDPELQVKLTAPIIQQVEDSADILGQAYIDYVQNGEKATPEQIRQVEGAIRKIFTTILAFTKELKELPEH